MANVCVLPSLCVLLQEIKLNENPQVEFLYFSPGLNKLNDHKVELSGVNLFILSHLGCIFVFLSIFMLKSSA